MPDKYADLIEELEYEMMLCQRFDSKNLLPGLERAMQIIEEMQSRKAE